jgi:hypothetical protein
MPLTQAAQAVQRSAFPTAYAAHEQAVTGLVALFWSKALAGVPAQTIIDSGLCGGPGTANCPATGLPVEAGLTPTPSGSSRCVKHQWPQLTSFAGVGNRPEGVDFGSRPDGPSIS